MPFLPLLLLAAIPVFSGRVILPAGEGTLAVPLRATMEAGAVTTYEVDVDAAALLPELARELTTGVEGLAASCHQELAAGEPSFAGAGGSIAVVLPVSFTQYLCTEMWGKKKLFSEQGRIRSLIGVEVEGGRPRLVLKEFSVDGLSRMAATARTDLLLKAALEREIKTINESDELAAITRGLDDEGFLLTGIRAAEDREGLALLLSMSGPRGKEHFRRALDRTAAAFQ
ncbi:hypothetical protein [Parvularcula maris]|uniref:Uncharacterized protein n=1 Tax=Parvularcula maris TaxID=2965077 RepID=A0A9X2LB15_9PROT|nr:hypothetical protein [Parvularcula maris]MCQ8186395.1 hypothetical protein [Parvularcula maris]